MKPEPTQLGQTAHAAAIKEMFTQVLEQYVEAMETDDTIQDVSVNAVMTGLVVFLLGTAKDCDVSVEKLCTDILKAQTAMDAIETLQNLANDGQTEKSDAEFQSERIMQELISRVNK